MGLFTVNEVKQLTLTQLSVDLVLPLFTVFMVTISSGGVRNHASLFQGVSICSSDAPDVLLASVLAVPAGDWMGAGKNVSSDIELAELMVSEVTESVMLPLP